MPSRALRVRARDAPVRWRAGCGARAAGAIALLLGVACGDGVGARPSATSQPRATAHAAAVAAVAAAVASAATPPRPAEDPPLPAHVERARVDTLERVPLLRGHPRVRTTFAPAVRAILERPDEVVLYSVSWLGDPPLQELLDGKEEVTGVVGHRRVPRDGFPAVKAWLFDGMTRPFGGMKCNQPHHGLLLRRGGDRVAISICFECGTFAMRTSLRGVAARTDNVRWDPAFRSYLKHLLTSAGIADLSSDIRP